VKEVLLNSLGIGNFGKTHHTKRGMYLAVDPEISAPLRAIFPDPEGGNHTALGVLHSRCHVTERHRLFEIEAVAETEEIK